MYHFHSKTLNPAYQLNNITNLRSRQQRRAYALTPYPCIGLLRFLICTLSTHHIYPFILERLHAGATYLDLGACFAQDIRKLTFDGVPVHNCIAVDLEPGFFSISYDLFRDSVHSLPASLVGGDVFEEEQEIWKDLERRIAVVHASSFFHLFGLPKQVQIARAIFRLVKPVEESLVLGLQLAAKGEAEAIPVVSEEEPTYCHSKETMQALWTNAGRDMGLESLGLGWIVEVCEKPMLEQHRVGLLANPKLVEVMWVAKTVKIV